jgi:hypothetical protein
MSTPLKSTATSTTGDSTEPKKGKVQTFLDRWIEPPTKNPTPSFEEHGLHRGGVLQEMAPLGAMPSARLRARMRQDATRNTHKPAKNGTAATPEGGMNTPELSPIGGLNGKSTAQKTEESTAPWLDGANQEEADDDYQPVAKRVKQTAKATRAAAAAAAAIQDTPKDKTRASRKNSTTQPTIEVKVPKKYRSMVMHATKTKLPYQTDESTFRTIESVFEGEKLKDPERQRLLENIISVRRDGSEDFLERVRSDKSEEMKQFRKLIRSAKRSIRSGASDSNGVATPASAPPASTQPAAAASNTRTRSSRSQRAHPVQDPAPATDPRPSKRRRMSPAAPHPSSSPTKRTAVNGNMSSKAATTNGNTQVNGTTGKGGSAHARKSSVGSSSDLSSIDEAIDADGRSPEKKTRLRLKINNNASIDEAFGPDSMALRKKMQREFPGLVVNESSDRSTLTRPKRSALNYDLPESKKRRLDDVDSEASQSRPATRLSTPAGPKARGTEKQKASARMKSS